MRRFLPYIYVLFFFTACHAPVKYISYEYSQYGVQESATDSQTEKMILPYRRQLETEMNEVIGYSGIAMPKLRGEPETLLGNFVSDLVLKMAKQRSGQPIDFCLLNNGGFRTSLPQGNITRGNIFELMPFENELVILTLPSSAFKKLLTYLAVGGGQPIAGLRMEIQNEKPVHIYMNGKQLTDTDTSSWKVVTSDYLFHGGDGMSFLAEATTNVSTGYKLRDAIIDYIREEQEAKRQLNASLDGRIKKTSY